MTSLRQVAALGDRANGARHVTKAEKTGDREVAFTVDMPSNRELPHLQPMSVIILAGALVDGIGNLQLPYCRGRTIILT